MSKLRPECGRAKPGSVSIPRDTALFLIRDAVEQEGALIYGRLHDKTGHSCAMGAFWNHNDVAVDTDLVDEVATVNDAGGPEEDAKKRWQRVRSWLRWKVRVMALKSNAAT